MQIKVTVASVLLALSVVNAAPVHDGETLEARRLSSFKKLAGTTPNERLQTGLAAGSTGLMAAGMFGQPQRREEAEPLEARRLSSFKKLAGSTPSERLQTGLAVGGTGLMAAGMFGQPQRREEMEARGVTSAAKSVGSGAKSLIGKTPNEALNTGLTLASTGMLASNTFGQQKREDIEERGLGGVVKTVGKGVKSLAGKTPNEALNTGLAAAGASLAGINTFGKDKRDVEDEFERRAFSAKAAGSGIKSLAGKTPNEALNTGLALASTGMLASNTFGQQKREELQDRAVSAKSFKSGAKSIVGKTPNEVLNTGLAAAGTGMMAYNMFGNPQQKREELQDRAVSAKSFKSGAKSIVGKTPNEALNTGLAAAGTGMMAYNMFGNPQQKREELQDRAVSGKSFKSGAQSIVGKTPNEALNTGLAAAGTGMMAYNMFGNPQQRDLGDEVFVYERDLLQAQ